MPKTTKLIFNSEKKRYDLFKTLLVLSFLLHFLLVFVRVEITPNKDQASKKDKTRVVLKLNKKERDIDKKQIVNTEENGQKVKPVDSRFLGKTNQKFAKQEIARKVGKFKVAKKTSQVNKSSSSKQNKTRKSNQHKKFKAPNSKRILLSDLAIKKVSRFNKKEIKEEKQNAFKRARSLNESQNVAQNNDYINDIPLGDVTNLNTIEYKFYGFYFRIRQQIEQHWGNSLREVAKTYFRTGRGLSSGSDKITSLTVVLDKKGKILKINVRGSSGIKELDDAAVNSFNKAGPFPNPPKELVKDGIARIEWGFVVKA
jgi:protein TonB